MAIKLADTLAPMADFPAVEAKDVAFNDNKSLQEKYDNGELGGGTSITVDTAMSSTSTNPVQNKVIKEYVDNKSTNVSEIDGNAIIKKSDGLFVEDLSSELDKINFAQKTVNDIGSVSLLDTPYLFTTTPATTMGNASNNRLEHDLILNESILNYDEIQILISMGNPNDASTYVKRVAQPCTFKVSSIQFNPSSDSADYSNAYATLVCENTTPSSVAGTYGNIKFTLTCWFKDDKTLHLHTLYNPHTSTKCSSFMIDNILGIKEKTIIVDPLEYVNTKSGIEDTPVGEIIRTIGNKTPKHYLMCDGSTHNIADYPYLAQYFKDTFGAINVFGGDGTTTFGVPDKSTDTWWTPGLVNGVVPSPYAVYVSSVFNTTQHQKELLFDGIISADSCWHSKADGSDTDIWVKFDFGKNTCIQGLRMAARSIEYLNQLPSTFTIEGSYDDVTYTVIKSYSRLPSPTSTNFREHLFDKPVNYRYYKLNHMTSNAKNNSYDYCSIAELEFSKVDNIQYIKAEPTYFMNLEGVEVTEDLLTDKSFDITTNGVTTIDKSFTLPTPITDFDEIETVYSYEKAKANVKDSVSGKSPTVTELTPTSDYKGINFPGTSTSGITYQTISGLTYPLTVEIAFSTTSTGQIVFVHDVGLNLIIGITDNYIQLATVTHASKTNMAYNISSWNLYDGNFHTITVTYNSADSASLYFDGVLKPSTTYSGTWTMTNISSIGNRFNSPYDGAFKGTLYAVRFYNDILSQSDIVASYNSDKDYVLNNTAQIARNNLACEYKLYDSVEIIHPYITSSRLSVRDIEYNSVLSVDKSVQNVTNNKAASTELQYTFIDKNNVKFLNVSNHYNSYLPGSKFGIRRLTGIKKISK